MTGIYDLTYLQFESLLTFVFIMHVDRLPLEHSPDYIIEKFEAYCGKATAITPPPYPSMGAHAVVRRDLIEPYFRLWRLEKEKFAQPAHP